MSLGRAAKIAGLPLSGFIDRLCALKIPVARYSHDELSREVAEFGSDRYGCQPLDGA